jgi:cold shock CspA family protein
MKDQVIQAYLTDFIKQFDLVDLDEATAFELFATHSIISRYDPDHFEPEQVSVGGKGDLGLDGAGILVNDHLAFARTSVDYFKKALRRLDVQFVFVQAKTSQHFEASEIGSFLSGVRQFFRSSSPVTANGKICELHLIKEHIYASSIDMDRSPTCRLYYVTTGTWRDEPDLRMRIDQGVADLKQTGLFSLVDFIPVDADSLKQISRELRGKITREIAFEKHAILPQIAGVEEAYIGIVPCREYMRLICDADGDLNRRLFYDNVRDFQGHNAVNSEIEGTVQDSARSDRFAVPNNGITIVARTANKVGATFRLQDYQIVNGCQTSHILYLNRQYLTEKVYVPLKLIVTDDGDVINQIIQGNNRQTEVKVEAFESLAPFQKELEEFYQAVSARRTPLYYERRSKQYENLGIKKDRIVTLATQVKCFVAMFLNEPHSIHRYYGELLSSYRTRIFAESHSLMPYFVSGMALTTLERLLAESKIPRAWKAIKFHLLMVFRIQNQPFELPFLNSTKIERYCDALLNILDDKPSAEVAFRRAGTMVMETEKTMPPSREPLDRTRAFTTALIEAAGRGAERTATAARMQGTVKWFSDIKGYGFIEGDDGTDLFVHYTSITGRGFRWLEGGQRVEYSARQTPKGTQAVDVETVHAN